MRVIEQQKNAVFKSLTELADAHCHLDIIHDAGLIRKAIERGVISMVTNGVDIKSNMKALELADNKNIFAALGMDPEHIVGVPEHELDRIVEFNLDLARQNRNRIIGIGEIGLDYKNEEWRQMASRQKLVFVRFIKLAAELDLPISVHARSALKDVFQVLEEEHAEKVHLHYFEGDEKDAELAVKRGYMISVPPIESSKRRRMIASTPIENLMAESDAPVVGNSPMAVEQSVRLVAEAKSIDFEGAAAALTNNTKGFFGFGRMQHGGLIRI
ncbi:MAG: TatD family hydrolase [Candidatus Marsarchaeota archaeon]|nr:TatD family hydrolase [Candidatus Marsarchaeota archaeon]MCL5115509.1 TatD family hydrolase [Candidatus Marsarchaeota archaeon]